MTDQIDLPTVPSVHLGLHLTTDPPSMELLSLAKEKSFLVIWFDATQEAMGWTSENRFFADHPLASYLCIWDESDPAIIRKVVNDLLDTSFEMPKNLNPVRLPTRIKITLRDMDVLTLGNALSTALPGVMVLPDDSIIATAPGITVLRITQQEIQDLRDGKIITSKQGNFQLMLEKRQAEPCMHPWHDTQV